jgi:hypothetical protein
LIEFDSAIMLVPHADAPLVKLVPADQLFCEAVRLMQQVPSRWSAEDITIIKNVALSNLFFFLKYIAGFSGPYTQLKADLHMEMCNWRMRALEPGSWSAGFCPRSTFKSSVWTHGPVEWELLRNPDMRIGIFSCILDRFR